MMLTRRVQRFEWSHLTINIMRCKVVAEKGHPAKHDTTCNMARKKEKSRLLLGEDYY